MCGWAQGCHTADVDALLFGAITVYRTLALTTANAKATQMARCRRSAVQRVLQLQRGGMGAARRQCDVRALRRRRVFRGVALGAADARRAAGGL